MADILIVRDFFNTEARPMRLQDMKTEWTPMPQADKDQIIQGLKDGSLTY